MNELLSLAKKEQQPVIPDDAARRAHFTALLAEELKDPTFRAIEGFPIGSDEAILAMSDPPCYTACPNPWIADVIAEWEAEKKTEEVLLPQTPPARELDSLATLNREENLNTPTHYHREPFAADGSEGKNEPVYNAHSYHTKVPHKAIMRYILHYTEPGDIVFDGFCGSGMTGVAAQMCASASTENRLALEETARAQNSPLPFWGKCHVILRDLSPAATSIAANYTLPFEIRTFSEEIKKLLCEIEQELGWMYETCHTDGRHSPIVSIYN